MILGAKMGIGAALIGIASSAVLYGLWQGQKADNAVLRSNNQTLKIAVSELQLEAQVQAKLSQLVNKELDDANQALSASRLREREAEKRSAAAVITYERKAYIDSLKAGNGLGAGLCGILLRAFSDPAGACSDRPGADNPRPTSETEGGVPAAAPVTGNDKPDS